ncbi:MAG: undecaprenyl-diphosphate phosphatase, partial [Kiloniellales bacterium]|nr:undecaprenyl-diphosphate phosphatase [Kiloniellales bacterium]
MALLYVFILALVQGITEFLPVSSSGHLVLIAEGANALNGEIPLKSEAENLTLNIAVHVGTLFAVCLYFWRDLLAIAKGGTSLLSGHFDQQGKLLVYIIVATVPIAIMGLFFKENIALDLQNVEVVAWATIIFAIVLYFADTMGLLTKKLEDMSLGPAALIGIAQVLALIPGTSRSGITISMALVLGFERKDAARFSMLLAIPTIAGAGLLGFYDLVQASDLALGLEAFVSAFLAFIFALAAI